MNAEVVIKAKKTKVVAASAKSLAEASGRRKTAVARVVILKSGAKDSGVFVNGGVMQKYFDTLESLRAIQVPFDLLQLNVQAMGLRVVIRVSGGGKSGQAGAVVSAISKALVVMHPDKKAEMSKAGLLTCDDRRVERKKYGHAKARKRRQFSKR